MKPVFKCDYCSKMGTEEEIREHESMCTDNYDRKSCYTCAHRSMRLKDKTWCYQCEAGKEVQEGKVFEFCDSYKRRIIISLDNLFG